MRKERTLFIIGLVVAVLPFLGFPETWREVFFIILGIMLIYLAYLFYLEAKSRMPKDDNRIKSFIDNIKDGRE